MRSWLALTVLEAAAVLGPGVASDLDPAGEARAILVDLRSAPLIARFDALLGQAAGVEARPLRQ